MTTVLRSWHRAPPQVVLVMGIAALAVLGAAGCVPLATSVANLPSRFAEYELQQNVVFDPAHGLALDIYRPKPHVDDALPVVVFVHGGGWDTGSKDQYLFVAEALVSRGYVAVLPAYRLYPTVQFPAFVEDVAKAVAWTREHATDYGGDPARLWLMGHSAGAHIAAMLAFDERYLARAMGGPCRPSGFVGLAGPYDFLPVLSDELRAIFAGAEDPGDTQPISFVDGGEAPVLLLHGEADDTVWPRNSRRLAARIREKGGSVREVYYPDLDHGGIVAALSLYFRDRRDVLDDIDRFIEMHARSTSSCPVVLSGSTGGD